MGKEYERIYDDSYKNEHVEKISEIVKQRSTTIYANHVCKIEESVWQTRNEGPESANEHK